MGKNNKTMIPKRHSLRLLRHWCVEPDAFAFSLIWMLKFNPSILQSLSYLKEYFGRRTFAPLYSINAVAADDGMISQRFLRPFEECAGGTNLAGGHLGHDNAHQPDAVIIFHAYRKLSS